MPYFLIKSKKEFTFLKKVLHFARKCIIFERNFSGNGSRREAYYKWQSDVLSALCTGG